MKKLYSSSGVDISENALVSWASDMPSRGEFAVQDAEAKATIEKKIRLNIHYPVSRRCFVVGCTTVFPIMLASCVEPHPLDFERDLICSSNGFWSQAYSSTCSIMSRSRGLAFTLSNYIGYFIGGLFGEPVVSDRGYDDFGKFGGKGASSSGRAAYDQTVFESLNSGNRIVIEEHTVRDVNLAKSSNSDTVKFVNDRREIEKSGTASEKYRFESGAELLAKTCRENLETLDLSRDGYMSIVKEFPDLRTLEAKNKIDELGRENERTAALFEMIRLG